MGKKKYNNNKKEKITNESLLAKMQYNFSRDAEWFKRTTQKLEEIKEDLNKNFYDENKKKQKIDFIHKLKNKLKDYKDAIKFEDRYKKVRFVERRKLERKLNQINKKIENEVNNEENKKKLEQEKNNIIDDINYVKYYPKTYKYYSLFPNKDAENEEMIKKREKMKEKIKFFLNGKKNKQNNNFNNNIDKEEDNKSSSDKNEESDDENEEENKEEKNQNKEKVQEKEKKNKIKNNNNEDGKDYESFKQKKVFKDTFFELDENE